MTKQDLRAGERYWAWWMSRYLWYQGRAYNGKDFDFVDIADAVVVLNEEQIQKLTKEPKRNRRATQ